MPRQLFSMARTSNRNGPQDDILLAVARFMQQHATPTDWLDFLKVPLLISRQKNNPVMLRRLVQACGQLCTNDIQGAPFNTLHHAAKQGDRDMVELLVTFEHGLVDSKDEEGWVALHHAASRGNVPVIQVLLAHHSSCLAKTACGFIPVFMAIRGGHIDAVDCLLNAMPRGRQHKHVADVYRMPSISLIAVTNPGIFKALQKHVDKDRAVFRLWIRDVAAGGKAGTVAVLVEAGVDLEAPGLFPDGWSILHIAAHNCNDEVCNALLKHGANRDAKDDKGQTPLHRVVLCTAVRRWDRAAATAELLLNWGADVTATDCDGRTAADLVKAQTAPDRTKGPLAAVLAQARANQCSRPHIRAACFERQLARERRKKKPVALPETSPSDRNTRASTDGELR